MKNGRSRLVWIDYIKVLTKQIPEGLNFLWMISSCFEIENESQLLVPSGMPMFQSRKPVSLLTVHPDAWWIHGWSLIVCVLDASCMLDPRIRITAFSHGSASGRKRLQSKECLAWKDPYIRRKYFRTLPVPLIIPQGQPSIGDCHVFSTL